MPADAGRSAAPSHLYLPELPAAGAVLTLPDADARYLARVVRAKPGEEFTATDGRGAVARLALVGERGGEHGSEARVVSIEHVARLRESVVLCGAPEGERGDWLVEKLAELGVAVLQPIDTGRATWNGSERRTERWQRLAVAALRQSLSAHRLEIRPPRPVEEAVAALPAGPRWVANVAGPWAAGTPAPAAGACGLAIGPAPGFTPDEREQLAAAGFLPIRLAECRLRTETACLALASWWAGAGATRPPHLDGSDVRT